MATHIEEHDRGLAYDLATLNRRRALALFGGAGLAVLLTAGCDTATAENGTTCTEIPEETAGPYPGDGSNGPNVLDDDGIVRSDIRSSFGTASGSAEGVPLTIRLTIQDGAACEPLPGAAVYLWHCDPAGGYSLYSPGIEAENYLRGVQVADDSGVVEFTSVFPGCYAGRWPHIHFEVYASLDDATAAGEPVATSQLGFPEKVCTRVYALDGYDGSASNLASVSLDSDMVFADGWDAQLATVTGSPSAGYTAKLTVPVPD